ncbi:MAG: ComEC/Rec2 family competence protein, partial [Clostridiales bacterium]|nr:ComEC/Rec2 family competence protein [Clostridiales bacterium]
MNKRIIPLFALMVTATILLRYVTGITVAFGVVLRVLLAGCLLVFGVVCFFRSKRRAAILLFALLGVGIACGICYDIRLNTYHSFLPESNIVYEVSGIVDTRATSYDEVRSVTLSSLTVNGKRVKGKLRLYFEDDVSVFEVAQGSRIDVGGMLYAIKPIDGKYIDAVSFRKDVRYKMYATNDAFRVSAGKPGLFASIRLKLYNRLISAMGLRYGAVAYGMLTGDKSELDETSIRLYSVSGLGHILSVSGLHIGLLAALLLFLFEKCHVPRLIRVIVTFCLLILYAAFVGFTASVMRAVIMCGVMMIALLCGERKDTFSTLALAFCLILVVSPFNVFEVGFLMSFAAVFGLTLFYNTFYKVLTKIRCPKFVAAPIATTTAVQVGILPVVGYFFASFQTYSVLFNLLLIPVLTATFVLLVCLLPFVLLFSAAALLRLAGIGIAFIDLVTGIVPSLPLHTIPIFSHKALFLLFQLYFA